MHACARAQVAPLSLNDAAKAARSCRPKVLPPQHRLTRSEDFRDVIRQGKRAGGRYVVMHVRFDSTRGKRVGFVVSKAVGNAVVRNRVRRRLRHIVKEFLPEVRPQTDIVLRAQPRAAFATYSELCKDTYRGLQRIGVIS